MAMVEPWGAPAHTGHLISSGLRHIPIPAWALLMREERDPHTPKPHASAVNKDSVESKVVPPWTSPGGQTKCSLDHQTAPERAHLIATAQLYSKLNT